MAHAHGSPERPPADPTEARRLAWAIAVIATFAIVEVIGGLWSGSLALLADAGHMVGDLGALALAWGATVIAERKPPDLRRSYGYGRFRTLAAFVNGLLLGAIALWIAIEAVLRLLSPGEIMAAPMLAVAVVGLLANILAFRLLRSDQPDREPGLNRRAAAVHVMGDLVGSVAAIVAALVIMATGWTPIDALLSLLVAGLIGRAASDLVARSGHVLLEGTPETVDPEEVAEHLRRAVPEVRDIHHVHIWSLGEGEAVLTLHAVVEDDTDTDEVLATLHAQLAEEFGIAHATVQVERPGFTPPLAPTLGRVRA